MRLSTLAAVARRRASTLGHDATRWHRIECAAREALRRAEKRRRQLERKTTVDVSAPCEAIDCPLDED